MPKITYSKSGDFSSGVMTTRLYDEINDITFAEPTVILSHINIFSDNVQIHFGTLPTGSDLLLLDSAIAAHNGSVAEQPSGDEGIDADEPFPNLKVSGFPAMSGNIDMDRWDIVNITSGNYSFSTHGAIHEQSGSAEIDGDKLDIDFTPSNYTPSTSPSEVDNPDQLSAHLAGIDSALSGFTTGSTVVMTGDVSGSSDNNTVIAIQNVSVTSSSPSDGDMLYYNSDNNRYEFINSGSLGAGDITTGSINYRYLIWAEENGALNDTNNEWSYGNGATGVIGIPIYEDGELVGMTYNAETAGDATTEVEVRVNGSSVGGSITPGNGVNNATTTFGSPISVSTGDLIGFQTVTAGGASDVRVSVVIQNTASISGLKGDKGDPGDPGAPGGGLTEGQHKWLRHLIHFIDSGPADNFEGTGSYFEVVGSLIFPDKEIWWESTAKINKIYEIEYSYTGSATFITPTPIVYRMYNSGSFIVGLKDDITYSGVFEQNRNRTVIT